MKMGIFDAGKDFAKNFVPSEMRQNWLHFDKFSKNIISKIF